MKYFSLEAEKDVWMKSGCSIMTVFGLVLMANLARTPLC